MQTLKLISIYYHVCDKYKEDICQHVQRFSTNQLQGQISDEEIMTIYLFCTAYEQKQTVKSMYEHIRNYWLSWFPGLPSYQAFNDSGAPPGLNGVSEAFPHLVVTLSEELGWGAATLPVLLGDSMPIVTCAANRSGKVARQLTDKGYCASKRMHYYGVKLHLMGLRRQASLPLPKVALATPASVHDLTALRPLLETLRVPAVLDKAYCDATLAEKVAANGAALITPVKAQKGRSEVLQALDSAYEGLFNTAVSKIRQPIEALFSWLEEKTGLQRASKVRSEKGLIVHIFGKLAPCLLLLANLQHS